jgi:transcription-repair coupling factor (superfamily II helicase)
VLLVAESEGRRESLLDLLRDHQISVPSVATLAEFLAGRREGGHHRRAAGRGLPLARTRRRHRSIQFVTETELFASHAAGPAAAQAGAGQHVDALIKDLSELKVGDPVVHINHGIGRYQGLINIDLGEGASEFLHLEYADKATLYVPVAQLHLISRYTGVSADEAPLHRLGSASGTRPPQGRRAGARHRGRAAQPVRPPRRARRLCAPLQPARLRGLRHQLRLRGDGRPARGHPRRDPGHDQPAPMDRLVCGDVGFGKTEVALRAAFVAVHGGKQVAILAPTTLLAEQHYQTLVDRFGKWPVKIAELSRFRSPKEVKAALEGIADGTSTSSSARTSCCQPDVKFKRLGLLVIDEEHRFGVRHKEAMKALRAEVDVLTLTATPIPRTLGMALEGLRDLSSSPPRRSAGWRSRPSCATRATAPSARRCCAS